MMLANSRSIAAAGAVAAMALAASPTWAETWRLTHFAGDTSAFYTMTTLPFVERVAELTDGELTIQPFPGG